MFVNCLKMTSRIFLTALCLLTISFALASEEGDKDSTSLKSLGRSSHHRSRKTTMHCQDHSYCRKRELCHSVFKICFPKQTHRTRMKLTKNTRTSPSCKSNDDCRRNQSCHAIFGTCVDIPRMQPTIATKSRAAIHMCNDNSECPGGQYCHDFFNMCLPNLTLYFKPTSSPPVADCRSNTDCKNGEFCHNLSRLCLPFPTPATTDPTRKGSYACSSHADCKMTEFCHFLIGMRRRDQTRTGAQDKTLKNALGVCIARALKEVPDDPSPVFLNCSQSSECGKGRCCLSDLGLCVGYRLPGQLCVAEEVSFSCPCLPGFTCISRRRPMRMRRLQKKLKLTNEAIKKLNLTTTEFKVGKCQLLSD